MPAIRIQFRRRRKTMLNHGWWADFGTGAVIGLLSRWGRVRRAGGGRWPAPVAGWYFGGIVELTVFVLRGRSAPTGAGMRSKSRWLPEPLACTQPPVLAR
jgi:hypothetical protein